MSFSKSFITASRLVTPAYSSLIRSGAVRPLQKTFALSHPSSSLAKIVDEFFSTPFTTGLDPFPSKINHQTDLMRRISPAYELNEDDTKVELSVEVPGVKAEDMNVELRHDDRVLHISGKRTMKQGGSTMESTFEKSFSLGNRFDGENITAKVSDGILMITAPKTAPVEKVRKIAVTEG